MKIPYTLTVGLIYRIAKEYNYPPYGRDEICCKRIARFLFDLDQSQSYDELWQRHKQNQGDEVSENDHLSIEQRASRVQEMQRFSPIFIDGGTDGVWMDQKIEIQYDDDQHKEDFHWFFAYVLGRIGNNDVGNFIDYHLTKSFMGDKRKFIAFLKLLDSDLVGSRIRFVDHWTSENAANVQSAASVVNTASSLAPNQLSGNNNRTRKKSTKKPGPCTLEDLFGSQWKDFQKDFNNILETRARIRRPTATFHDVIYFFWSSKKKDFPENVSILCECFFEAFGNKLGKNVDTLRKGLTKSKLTDYTTIDAIQNVFIKYV